jgi:hypothetical protein
MPEGAAAATGSWRCGCPLMAASPRKETPIISRFARTIALADRNSMRASPVMYSRPAWVKVLLRAWRPLPILTPCSFVKT